MSTRTQSFVVLLFGAVLLRIGFSDLLLRFVRPWTRPLVLAAGLLILALAVWSLLPSRRGRSDADSDTDGDTDGDTDADTRVDMHGHARTTRLAWLVLAPVVAVLVIGPPALGAYTANRTPARKPTAAEAFGPLARTGVARMSVTEFALRSYDRNGRTLRGHRISVVGFVARAADHGWVIARLVITCCAADAIPVEIVARSSRSALPLDRWVRVTGTYDGRDDHDNPVLRDADITTVAAPSNPYDH